MPGSNHRRAPFRRDEPSPVDGRPDLVVVEQAADASGVAWGEVGIIGEPAFPTRTLLFEDVAQVGPATPNAAGTGAVSYTHLTLPTKRIV